MGPRPRGRGNYGAPPQAGFYVKFSWSTRRKLPPVVVHRENEPGVAVGMKELGHPELHRSLDIHERLVGPDTKGARNPARAELVPLNAYLKVESNLNSTVPNARPTSTPEAARSEDAPV